MIPVIGLVVLVAGLYLAIRAAGSRRRRRDGAVAMRDGYRRDPGSDAIFARYPKGWRR